MISERAKKDLPLVERAQQGDGKAFAELLERYRDAVYRRMAAMVGNATDAEDLTIEAFGKAFRNIGAYSPQYAFGTWLFAIANNNAIDFLRRRRGDPADTAAREGENGWTDANIPSGDKGPEDLLIDDQKRRNLRQVVRLLKPNYRRLVELRYFDELTCDEIAAQLAMPVGTVKAQLFRARELLNNMVGDKDNL